MREIANNLTRKPSCSVLLASLSYDSHKKKSHLMRRDFFILIQSLILADDVHLGDEVLSVGVFVDNEEHIASIEADAALQVLLKIDIT